MSVRRKGNSVRYHDRLDVPLRMGVGAAFDFTAGTKKQAPEWASRAGLEWFVRWCDEPRRLTGCYIQSLLLLWYFLLRNGAEMLRLKRQL